MEAEENLLNFFTLSKDKITVKILKTKKRAKRKEKNKRNGGLVTADFFQRTHCGYYILFTIFFSSILFLVLMLSSSSSSSSSYQVFLLHVYTRSTYNNQVESTPYAQHINKKVLLESFFILHTSFFSCPK